MLLVWLVRVVRMRVTVGSREHLWDEYLLLALGLGLLFFVGWGTALVFIYVSTVTYWGTWILVRRRQSGSGSGARIRAGLVLSFFQLIPLVWFKYSYFLSSVIVSGGVADLGGLLIPVGVSFYTFQCMSFSWDSVRGAGESGYSYPRWIDFMNYAGFFPQIVAGPIERKKDLLPQMQGFRFRYSRENIEAGTRWVVIGLFFKLGMADNFAVYSVPGEAASSAWQVHFQNLVFGMRIYFDFAGYSLVALGVGRWFGIRLTVNFLSPYTQSNMTDFWRCWHVTLSQWFRDYVYFPLGGNRWTRGIVPLLIVFLVSGVWHGAGWNFILWGGMHGILVLSHRWGGRIRIPSFLGWGLTMAGVFLAWLFFYQTDLAVLKQNLGAVLTPSAYSVPALKGFLASRGGADLLVLFGLCLITSGILLAEFFGQKSHENPYHYLSKFPVLMLLILLTVVMAPGARNSFIYFAF